MAREARGGVVRVERALVPELGVRGPEVRALPREDVVPQRDARRVALEVAGLGTPPDRIITRSANGLQITRHRLHALNASLAGDRLENTVGRSDGRHMLDVDDVHSLHTTGRCSACIMRAGGNDTRRV